MSENRKHAQAIYKALHHYIMSTYPADESSGTGEAENIKRNRADSAAKKVSDEIISKGKPMGVWVQYAQYGSNTQIYVFYHPNPAAHKVW